jgi:hypothetical protein
VGDKLTKISEYLASIDAIDNMDSGAGTVAADPYWAIIMDPAQRVTSLFEVVVTLMGIIDGVDEAIEAIDDQALEGSFDRAKKVKDMVVDGSTKSAAIASYVAELKAEIQETSALKAGVIAGMVLSMAQHHNDDIEAHE